MEFAQLSVGQRLGMFRWLRSNYNLTCSQAAEFCDLDVDHALEASPGVSPFDPVANGLVSRRNLKRAAKRDRPSISISWEWTELYGIKQVRKVASARILEAYSSTCWYLTYGRNAWHSTWITRYAPGCVAFDLELLKAKGERDRGPGNVFYIQEMPCLVLLTATATYLILEINGGDFITRLQDLLAETCDVARVVQACSTFPENTVLSLKANRRVDPPDVPYRHELAQMQSEAVGNKYLLNWRRRPAKPYPEAIYDALNGAAGAGCERGDAIFASFDRLGYRNIPEARACSWGEILRGRASYEVPLRQTS
jgi:hypothetical protein